MGVLYIVRHGQAPAHAYGPDADTVGGPGLTELGFAQARATGEALAAQVPQFDAMFCGDLPRQQATMAGILEAFPDAGAPTIDPDWNEYTTPALPEADDIYRGGGKPFQDAITRALHEWVDGADTGPETYAAYAARTRAAADRAAAAAGSGKTVLVVSSAGSITQLVAQLWDVPGRSWPQMSRTFVNTSVTKVLAGGRGMTLVSLNAHDHVSALGSELMSYR
ncbi:histidine phosphatase family protein [Gordonia neofelifaecis]|uniref:Phosphoglycerate mutase n=1 Tax=Gordonia neofelifaecis NRRL B-59395 TaxID=644548 RepID=F1YKG5_9ACTN|nr:histidine phosphatase family protein [Gordonia neofelifaecis]EGD54851.1 phosphoglycerate mutase [Gordonia neofelifaecis NRRL B-59395]